MAGRSRSTFGKRQKEQKRQEKRREKTARRDQRKLEKQSGTQDGETQPIEAYDAFEDDLNHTETTGEKP